MSTIRIECGPVPPHRFLGLTCATVQGIRVARRLRPGLVIAGSGVNAPPAWAAAKASGARWMVYLHGLDLVVKNAVYQRAFLPIIRRADAWLVNSRATAQLAAAAGLDSRRLHICTPGCKFPTCYPPTKRYAPGGSGMGLGDRPFCCQWGA